ncbi:hypothetical protein ACFQZO_11840 [Bradyrhizobium sp. GCM10027634]|uniref:hypothetical protein n=1 Tax=unclassified Bradyrhizobium TaxID=2631580 RepID=UPI00188DC5FA|nr:MULTISPECIES: hypothetical protein [unclassified Bradyrhizobium]MDN5001576.1 hypothetical protein [Bradyrhizobium sp. WYCCWR 12677]QOZ46087.1 hypothetical protein XH89_23370 [Bradyrhizobium sp. CCBAU 53340]
MRTASWSLAGKFHVVVDRMVAALRQQRAIEARRVLLSYRHLLGAQPETSSLNEFISVCNEKEVSENAYQSDARGRSTARPGFQRA